MFIMNYYIGMDQGATKTHAVVCSRSGQILALGQSQGAYHLSHGLEKQLEAIQTAAQHALSQVPGADAPVDGLYAGLIGVDWPDEQDFLTQKVQALNLAADVHVVNDAYAALRGGTSQASGEKFLYHYYQEDELQGGTALGRAALKAIYRSATGRAPVTRLTDSVLQFTNTANVDTLLRLDVEKHFPVPVSQLAPLVFAAADCQDKVAIHIISKFAAGLAELVTTGLQRFAMTDLAIEIVVSGSIFKTTNPILLDTLIQHIHRIAPQARLVQARYEPVIGAAMLALEKAGVVITPDIQQNIEKTSVTLGLIRPGTISAETFSHKRSLS
jgi:N-acetylglucosamine kinase-like BadF-type ATPase